ncbi:cbb3-type cytochrome oxidase subunit 3 [Bermanella sp. R86510]|uniref:cbb3-type cytochrome oxidase subunit 3 n=1 Tax=unclassified Bermanella TaxID=2627862 RepID=UPI0037C54DE7
MDINDVRGLGTVFALIAFIGIIAWAYSSSRKKRFDDDADMIFKDDDIAQRTAEAEKKEND